MPQRLADQFGVVFKLSAFFGGHPGLDQFLKGFLVDVVSLVLLRLAVVQLLLVFQLLLQADGGKFLGLLEFLFLDFSQAGLLTRLLVNLVLRLLMGLGGIVPIRFVLGLRRRHWLATLFAQVNIDP